MAQPHSRDPVVVQALVKRGFEGAPFVKDVGLQFVACGHGWCEAALDLQPRHFQHTGVVHAGVITTLADHCAGGAGQLICGPGEQVVTLEFKINLLRPGVGERLTCRAEVLKPGKSFHVVEAQVWAHRGDVKALVAKLNATLAVVLDPAPAPASRHVDAG
jgi:uncharacterized protein (TIGR00369 family)